MKKLTATNHEHSYIDSPTEEFGEVCQVCGLMKSTIEACAPASLPVKEECTCETSSIAGPLYDDDCPIHGTPPNHIVNADKMVPSGHGTGKPGASNPEPSIHQGQRECICVTGKTGLEDKIRAFLWERCLETNNQIEGEPAELTSKYEGHPPGLAKDIVRLIVNSSSQESSTEPQATSEVMPTESWEERLQNIVARGKSESAVYQYQQLHELIHQLLTEERRRK